MPEGVAGALADRLGGRGAGRGRGRARTLHPGVHVGLVVVADVEHVVVALEHAGQAGQPDVDRPAVAALGDDTYVVAAGRLQCRGDAGRDRRGVGEQRVQPRQLPGALRVGRGEDLEAAGGVDGDELAAGRRDRGVEHVAGGQGLAAPLAGAVAGVQRVAPLRVGLLGAVGRVEQAVAHRPAADLVELHGLRGHAGPLPERRWASSRSTTCSSRSRKLTAGRGRPRRRPARSARTRG